MFVLLGIFGRIGMKSIKFFQCRRLRFKLSFFFFFYVKKMCYVDFGVIYIYVYEFQYLIYFKILIYCWYYLLYNMFEF